MDPITAIGLASSIIQIADFGSRVLSKTFEIYRSSDGSTNRNSDIEHVAGVFRDLLMSLQSSRAECFLSETASESESAITNIANECLAISEELFTALNKLRAQGSCKVWSSIRKALKSIMEKDTIERIRLKLDELKSQLQLSVLVDMSSTLKLLEMETIRHRQDLDQHSLTLIAALRESSGSFLAVIEAQNVSLTCQFRETRSLIEEEGRKTREHLDLSLRMIPSSLPPSSQQPDTAVSRMSMLMELHASLSFEAIDYRHDAIKAPHRKTFEWILDPEAFYSANGPRLLEWLQFDNGLYWISGKAGSGKSTLMRFIASEDRTLEALSTWCLGKTTLMADFYYSKVGTEEQRGLSGLLRTILFKTLEHDPELISAVLVPSVPSRVRQQWPLKKLRGCLDRLLSLSEFKTIIFIDGLDEMSGDVMEILDLIKVMSSHPNVKVCVSSRPWPIFQSVLGVYPGLKIQDLTESDIERYVRDKLMIIGTAALDYEEHEMKQVISTITHKAAGVFVWVETVVRSVMRGYFAQDSAQQLLLRVRSLPEEVHDLYLQMLSGVEDVYREKQSRLLAVAYFAASTPIRMVRVPALLVLFLEKGIDGALRYPILHGKALASSVTIERAQAQIAACSMGLLEVDEQGYVRFYHQTVKDFLDLPETKAKLLKPMTPISPAPSISPIATDESSPGRLILAALVVWLKQGLRPEDLHFRKSNILACAVSKTLWSAVMMALSLVEIIEFTYEESANALLWELDRVVASLHEVLLKEALGQGKLSQTSHDFYRSLHWSNVLLGFTSQSVDFLRVSSELLAKVSDAGVKPVPLDFLGLSASCDLSYFLEGELSRFVGESQGETAANDPSVLLLHALRRNIFYPTFYPRPGTVEDILALKANPNLPLGPESPWACFLERFFTTVSMTTNEKLLDTTAEVCGVLIESGADLDIHIWMQVYPRRHDINELIIVRISALAVIVACLGRSGGLEHALEQVVGWSNLPQEEIEKRLERGRVLQTRVMKGRPSQVSCCVMLDDPTRDVSLVDMGFLGGSPQLETAVTHSMLADGKGYMGWDLEFCDADGNLSRGDGRRR